MFIKQFSIFQTETDFYYLMVLTYILFIIGFFFSIYYLYQSYFNIFLIKEKHPKRFFFLISYLIFSFYGIINLYYKRSDGSFMVGNPFSFIYNFFIPEILLQFVCLLFFLNLNEYSESMNCSFIFKNYSILLIPLLLTSTLLISFLGSSLTFLQNLNFYQPFFAIISIFNDLFVILFLIIPLLRILKHSFKLDVLNLMKKKLIFLIIFNYLFIILLIFKIFLIFGFSLPNQFIDKGLDYQYDLLVFYLEGFNLLIFFLFGLFHIFFLIISLYLDYILSLVEYNTISNHKSVYLEVIKNLD